MRSMGPMAIPSAVSLDAETARRLEEPARRWTVSKASGPEPSRSRARRRALRALQESVASRGVDLAAWQREAAEIRAGSFPRLPDDP